MISAEKTKSGIISVGIVGIPCDIVSELRALIQNLVDILYEKNEIKLVDTIIVSATVDALAMAKEKKGKIESEDSKEDHGYVAAVKAILDEMQKDLKEMENED